MRSGVRRLVRSRVVVHTRDNRSLRGVLAASYRDCLRLVHAEYLEEAKPAELDGDVVVLRENISFVQVLGGEQ